MASRSKERCKPCLAMPFVSLRGWLAPHGGHNLTKKQKNKNKKNFFTVNISNRDKQKIQGAEAPQHKMDISYNSVLGGPTTATPLFKSLAAADATAGAKLNNKKQVYGWRSRANPTFQRGRESGRRTPRPRQSLVSG